MYQIQEVLAPIIGNKLAERVAINYETLPVFLSTTEAELCSVTGIGPKKAAQILTVNRLAKELTISVANDLLKNQIRTPNDVYNAFAAEMAAKETETMIVLTLDTKKRVMSRTNVYEGSLNAAVVRISEVLRPAVRENAASIILIHNHPSGDPTPSPEDVRVTEMIVEAGNLMNIQVFDHIIIGKGRYVSLKERRLGF